MYWFSIKLQNVIKNRIHFNAFGGGGGVYQGWGVSYTRMYFLFTGRWALAGGGGGAYKRWFTVFRPCE